MEEKGGVQFRGGWDGMGWGVLLWGVRNHSLTQHVTSDASPSLSVPAPSNLFACLCECWLRSSCSAHSELIDLSSASKNISLCHPPYPRFELCNLPSLSFQLKLLIRAQPAASTLRLRLHKAAVDV